MRIRSIAPLCALAVALLSVGCAGAVQSNLSKPKPNPTDPPTTTPQSSSSLQITTTQLPAGATGSAYNVSLTATGGTAPYVWSLGSGSLPDGLTMSSAGVISGQPTAASHTILTIDVSDSSAVPVNAETSLAIDVAAGAATPSPATTSPSPAGYYGTQIGADELAKIGRASCRERV